MGWRRRTDLKRACHIAAASILVLVTACSGAKEDKPGELSYWRTLTGAAGDAQDILVERFNTEHPGITVRSEFQGSYSDLSTKLIAAAVAQSGPQVTQLGTFEIREFARSGVLLDLTPMIGGEEGIDTSGWPADLIRAGQIEGGTYWLPFNVAVPVLYYNQDAFQETGIDGPPETWDQFFSDVRAITRRKDDGTVERHGLALWNITWPILSMIWSEGGELTNADYSNITLNDPVVVRLLTELQALVHEGAAILPDKASGGQRAAFISGRAAMILDSQDAFSEVFSEPHGFTPALANYPAGKKGKVYAPGGGGLAMLASTPEIQRDSAWSFIRFMLSPNSLAYYARQSGYCAFTEASREAAGDLLEDPRYATIHEAVPYLRGDFSVNMSPAVRTAFDEAFQKILVEGANVQETLNAADAKAEREVRDERSATR